MNKKEVSASIDQALLAPEVTINQVILLCQEAARYNFAAVCVNPAYVSTAATALSNSDVKVCAVVGFPFGANDVVDKVNEALNAIKNGADELDMVINIGNVKDGLFSKVSSEIAAVVQAAKKAGKDKNKNIIVKVIIETCFLNDNEIVDVCLCAKAAGADFIKTSTGFAIPKGIDGNPLPNGANEYHIRLIRKTIGHDMGIKASGGIRSARTARCMFEAGADRIETSSGANIVENWIES